MLRPISQHLFYLAAEVERISLLVDMLWDKTAYRTPDQRQAREVMEGAVERLQDASKSLLDAGNLLQEPR